MTILEISDAVQNYLESLPKGNVDMGGFRATGLVHAGAGNAPEMRHAYIDRDISDDAITASLTRLGLTPYIRYRIRGDIGLDAASVGMTVLHFPPSSPGAMTIGALATH